MPCYRFPANGACVRCLQITYALVYALLAKQMSA